MDLCLWLALRRLSPEATFAKQIGNAENLPQKSQSSIIDSHGPLSKPTAAVQLWAWELVFVPINDLVGIDRKAAHDAGVS